MIPALLGQTVQNRLIAHRFKMRAVGLNASGNDSSLARIGLIHNRAFRRSGIFLRQFKRLFHKRIRSAAQIDRHASGGKAGAFHVTDHVPCTL